jgi:hypothetical protein
MAPAAPARPFLFATAPSGFMNEAPDQLIRG